MKKISLLTLCLLHLSLFGQKVDVLHYEIELSVNDSSDVIYVKEKVRVVLQDADLLLLDLEAAGNSPSGMMVTSVTQAGNQLVYKHKGQQLMIRPLSEANSEETEFEINFFGTPSDGMVISENKFGQRTFFGDNWPNRAHLWFACVDHPSDKATVRFIVHAPDQYTCVAVGHLEKKFTENGVSTHVYYSEYPLPTKVMIIGLAPLSQKVAGKVDGIEVTSFVYPQNEKAGFYDLGLAVEPLRYFTDYIAAYPFEKLYNVQSTTRFGGMENAGCIFYDENAVGGNNKIVNLLAHEIAHQWFGNSASESDWPHLWLSEGLATYFTSLYIEHSVGAVAMQEQLRKDRQRVIDFYFTSQTPVVDTISTDLMFLLNPNSYQKGCWTLHMLREQIGASVFQQGIRQYYQKYAYKNASTDDFITVMEEVSGKDLSAFFEQWLRRSGHPVLKVDQLKKGKYEMVRILQNQEELFNFPLEVTLQYEDGSKEVEKLQVSERETIIPIARGRKLVDFVLDEEVKLLFDDVSQP